AISPPPRRASSRWLITGATLGLVARFRGDLVRLVLFVTLFMTLLLRVRGQASRLQPWLPHPWSSDSLSLANAGARVLMHRNCAHRSRFVAPAAPARA